MSTERIYKNGRVKMFTNPSSFTSNVYLIDGENPVIVDAGNDASILESLKDVTDKLDKVLITHSHPDHIGLSKEIKSEFSASIYAWDNIGGMVDEKFSDGQVINAGDSVLEVIHTPGHSPNHVVFYGDGALFSGDLIFPNGSFGRTDLSGGSKEQLVKSIEKVCKICGDEVEELFPGHMQPVENDASSHIKKSLKMAVDFQDTVFGKDFLQTQFLCQLKNRCGSTLIFSEKEVFFRKELDILMRGTVVEALILINMTVGEMEEVFRKIKGMKDVHTAAMLTGPYDIMAMTESDDIKKISNVILQNIRDIEYVRKTITCIVI